MTLRAAEAYWVPGSPVPEILNKDRSAWTLEEQALLIQELDRRFMQLWDKVNFENRSKSS